MRAFPNFQFPGLYIRQTGRLNHRVKNSRNPPVPPRRNRRVGTRGRQLPKHIIVSQEGAQGNCSSSTPASGNTVAILEPISLLAAHRTHRSINVLRHHIECGAVVYQLLTTDCFSISARGYATVWLGIVPILARSTEPGMTAPRTSPDWSFRHTG